MFEVNNGALCLNVNSEYISYIEGLANRLTAQLEFALTQLNSVLISDNMQLTELNNIYNLYDNLTVDIQKLYRVIVILKDTTHISNNKLRMSIITSVAMFTYLKSKHFHAMMSYIGDRYGHNIILDSSLYDPKVDIIRLISKNKTYVYKNIVYDSINKVVDNIIDFIGIQYVINDYESQNSILIRDTLYYILDFKPPHMKIS